MVGPAQAAQKRAQMQHLQTQRVQQANAMRAVQGVGGAPRMQEGGDPGVLQQANAQQLAAIVGSQEAECMMQPTEHIVYQKQNLVEIVNVEFRKTSHRMVPMTVVTPPTTTVYRAPNQQVPVTSCVGQPVMQQQVMQDECPPRDAYPDVFQQNFY